MRIAIGLYECFTALDAMGPYQVLSGLPGAEVIFVAVKAGPVTDDTGFLTVTARGSFDDVPNPDILLVPGGVTTVWKPRSVNKPGNRTDPSRRSVYRELQSRPVRFDRFMRS